MNSRRIISATVLPPRLAFTLTELLVVLAVISILAALLLPALARANQKALSVVCANNHRQVGIGFLLYLDENEDVFPTGAATSAAGAHAEDWIWWQNITSPGGQPAMRPPQGSALATVLGGFDPKLFRCPADRDALEREQAWKRDPTLELFTFSYGLNAHTEQGMATYISKHRSVIILNKHSSIVSSSRKIMLAEIKGSAGDGPGTAVIRDGRWLPLAYPLTMRHRGGANVTFADGRVERVPRSFADGSRPENWDPAY